MALDLNVTPDPPNPSIEQADAVDQQTVEQAEAVQEDHDANEEAFSHDLQAEQNPVDLNEFPPDEQLELAAQQPPPPVQAFVPTNSELIQEYLRNYINGGFDALNEDFKGYFGENLQVENFFTQVNHNNLPHNYYFARRVTTLLPSWIDYGRKFERNVERKVIIGHSRVFQKEGTTIKIAEYRSNVSQQAGQAEIVLYHIKSRD